MAKSQVGIRETGNNMGAVEKYAYNIGQRPPIPYCWAGLKWCSDSAARTLNISSPFPKTGLASVGRQVLDKQAKADSVPARIGVIFWQFPDSPFGHVDLGVEKLEGGWWKCIGFNTGGGGSQRDGGGVNWVKRNVNHPLAKMKLKQIIGLRQS